ncbi:outer membrane beta-barrel protein [Shewanella sp. Isolate11]|uniref:outer membrane beta-barrel protein n=1 Tax=Shewanella sp. Isolate11 TaxID=2908530 RepID=UPI001EFC5492|nr:outer membrane beta-barrel protein [Shewanella sp. Isolate11]MCG9696115.1 porin family protein [Shewanella sp. Isolate11]
MKRTFILILTLIGTLMSTSTFATAIADIKGYYLGGMVGYTEFETSNIDDSAMNYGVYAGYYTSKNFALETTYVRTSDIVDNGDVDNNYVSLAAKFHHYFSNTYSMFIKAGVASMNLDSDHNYDGIGWLWSAGFNMAFSNNINVRLAYEKIETDLEAPDLDDTMDSDLGNVYLGLHYQF